ncbi:MAG TPA: sigma-70 family RNA polymerase sigma factor [Variovorax sp.]
MTPETQAIGRAPDRFSMLFQPGWHLRDECVVMPVPQVCAPKPAAPAVDLQAHLATHYAQLHRRLARHLGCADFASECLHDAWLRLGEKRPQEAPANPDAYVYRVACNLAMDSLRSRKRWPGGANDEDADIDVIADLQPGPELIAEARSEVAAVDRAMQSLPRGHRSVLLALRWHEMSRQEVARRHGVSVRRVDTALRQALGVLR